MGLLFRQYSDWHHTTVRIEAQWLRQQVPRVDVVCAQEERERERAHTSLSRSCFSDDLSYSDLQSTALQIIQARSMSGIVVN